jgi:hypothetical protein
MQQESFQTYYHDTKKLNENKQTNIKSNWL